MYLSETTEGPNGMNCMTRSRPMIKKANPKIKSFCKLPACQFPASSFNDDKNYMQQGKEGIYSKQWVNKCLSCEDRNE